MKTIKSTLLLLLVSILTVNAQKIKVTSGSLKVLSGVDKINVEYDYAGMTVGKKKTEAQYIKEKKADYNKKEEGKGDKWEQSWVADRVDRYHPHFEELFNKVSGKTIGNFPDAKYTMIVKTTRTEPGYNIGISRKNAEIDAEIIIVETANRDSKKAKISLTRAPGRSAGGYDYDSGVRIEEAYEMAGKAFGKYVKKQAK